MISVSFIGAGNVATRLSAAFKEKGVSVPFIWNRTFESEKTLANELGHGTEAASSLTDLLSSDIIVIAVSDDAIPLAVDLLVDIINPLPQLSENSLPLCVHTSGATPLSVLKPLEEAGFRCGVLYPMITMSKNRHIDFTNAPVMIETASDSDRTSLVQLCEAIGAKYTVCDSLTRLRMHAAAVFSCNFTDYILGLAFDIAGKSSGMLEATTVEMIQKAFKTSPTEAMTGPAKRGDYSTIEKHIHLLESLGLDEQKEIYKTITDKILTKYHK